MSNMEYKKTKINFTYIYLFSCDIISLRILLSISYNFNNYSANFRSLFV